MRYGGLIETCHTALQVSPVKLITKRPNNCLLLNTLETTARWKFCISVWPVSFLTFSVLFCKRRFNILIITSHTWRTHGTVLPVFTWWPWCSSTRQPLYLNLDMIRYSSIELWSKVNCLSCILELFSFGSFALLIFKLFVLAINSAFDILELIDSFTLKYFMEYTVCILYKLYVHVLLYTWCYSEVLL